MKVTGYNSRTWFVFLAALLLSGVSFAADVAVLRNGFSIRHERREVMGAVTRLYVSADRSSYVDVPSLEIDHFEAAPPEAPAPGRNPVAAASVTGLQTALQNRAQAIDLNDVIGQASDRYRLDPDLVNSVIKAESGFNVRARSRKGAQGLMQLMPGTASKLGVSNAYDPQANVEGGTRYLRELLERYNFDLIKALAAYNAGPRRVEQYGGIPPYFETQAYVSRIVRDFNQKKLAQRKTAPTRASRAQTQTTQRQTQAKKSGPHDRGTAAGSSKTPATAASPVAANHPSE